MKPTKLFLGVKRGILVGFVISKEGGMANPEKIEVNVNLLLSTNVMHVQWVLGHTRCYRDVIEDYATQTLPLINLTKKMIKLD